ncbi:hypothetical protein PsYK624_123590 [Phanerochaete sordida]|uniref:Uncharacterized protein n=1 Tax=Phanerochaete sordida TaxID=48140 RepID=A0A9P3GJY9_9APHY|nr:hypothetical protein PsYK624_123590 [Phanerochaete sordida]
MSGAAHGSLVRTFGNYSWGPELSAFRRYSLPKDVRGQHPAFDPARHPVLIEIQWSGSYPGGITLGSTSTRRDRSTSLKPHKLTSYGINSFQAQSCRSLSLGTGPWSQATA